MIREATGKGCSHTVKVSSCLSSAWLLHTSNVNLGSCCKTMLAKSTTAQEEKAG